MIDKQKYVPLTVLNMFAIRSLLYPLTLVRTRLQVQSSGELYKGTFHALNTITRYEGYAALYKGFWVNSFQIVPHVMYITSFEKVSLIFDSI
jgi:solute carrier family 25 protein 44